MQPTWIWRTGRGCNYPRWTAISRMRAALSTSPPYKSDQSLSTLIRSRRWISEARRVWSPHPKGRLWAPLGPLRSLAAALLILVSRRLSRRKTAPPAEFPPDGHAAFPHCIFTAPGWYLLRDQRVHRVSLKARERLCCGPR